MNVEKVFIDGLRIERRLRPINEAAVVTIMESMRRLGQLQPITVYSPDEYTVILVAGAHRVEAAKRLGWDDLDGVFVTGDQVDLELRGIAENLHRADLTALERSTQIARWAELTAAKASQVETPSGGHRPTEKGVRKVAADLGLDKSDAQRAVKVASITDEAKQAARDAGLDDNRTALLVVAKAEPEAQVAKVKEIADEKAEREKQPAARSTTKITQARLEGLAGSIGGVLLALECAKPETIDLLVQDIAAGRYGVRSELEALRDWIDRLLDLSKVKVEAPAPDGTEPTDGHLAWKESLLSVSINDLVYQEHKAAADAGTYFVRPMTNPEVTKFSHWTVLFEPKGGAAVVLTRTKDLDIAKIRARKHAAEQTKVIVSAATVAPADDSDLDIPGFLRHQSAPVGV